MSTHNTASTSSNRLRLWPGLVLAALIVLLGYVVPAVAPDAGILGVPLMFVGVLGAVAGGLLVALWWLALSRVPWGERVVVLVLMVAALFVTSRVVHPSIANGMMGMMLPLYAIPALGLALVAAVAATHRLSVATRRAAITAAVVLVCGGFTVVRTGGMTGEGRSDLRWRWTPTAEEQLLAQEPTLIASPAPAQIAAAPRPLDGPAATTSPAPAPAPVTATEAPAPPTAGEEAPSGVVPVAAAVGARQTATHAPETAPADGLAISDRPDTSVEGPAMGERDLARARVEWAGFRGPHRNSVIGGVSIETDWTTRPPVELWRRAIGPGWSSFAVKGDLIFTQEQRGDDEVVSCYRLSTGQPIWQHRDAIRFWESNAGAGPRATPTLHRDRVYTMGATGRLNALDAATGARIWSRAAASDAGKQVPDWGIASSPLVVANVVIVAVAGRLAGFDADTGTPRWLGPEGGGGYSSPHLATIDGVPQVLLLRGSRTISVAPADGTLLWEHTWQPGVSIVQPAFAENGDVLVTGGDGMGGASIRRIAVRRGAEGWTVQERWTSRGLKPYFNDFVVHEGHAYGFDGSILSSISLTDGERRWKGGRYGHGQMVLLPEQDLLLILSEDGEVALVSATPHQYREIARMRVLEGKTWNHPVVVGDLLLVRNGEEMAAFRLPVVATTR